MLRVDDAQRQMRANFEALTRRYKMVGLYDIVETHADRVFIKNASAQRGEHGYGLLYDKLQFELTPHPLRRDDFFTHRNWQGLESVISWRSVKQPSDQWLVYPDWVVEVDFDLFSAKRDLRGMLGHFFAEYLAPRVRSAMTGEPRIKTDPFLVAELLDRNRGII